MTDARLRLRYDRLIVSQLAASQHLAAGIHAPPTLTRSFDTTRAAWRFFSNPRLLLPALAQPLVDHARQSIPECCHQYVLVALDWCNLHYNGHTS